MIERGATATLEGRLTSEKHKSVDEPLHENTQANHEDTRTQRKYVLRVFVTWWFAICASYSIEKGQRFQLFSGALPFVCSLYFNSGNASASVKISLNSGRPDSSTYSMNSGNRRAASRS